MKKKSNLIRFPDGREYTADELTELGKDDPFVKMKNELALDLINRHHGGIEKFAKHLEERQLKAFEQNKLPK